VRVFKDKKKVCFARMAEHDGPMGVRAVLERTKAPCLDYVGFSMGGMLAYAAIGARRIDPGMLRRVVIIGSPARVGHYVPLRHLLTRIPAPLVPPLPPRLGPRMVAFPPEGMTPPIPLRATQSALAWIDSSSSVERKTFFVSFQSQDATSVGSKWRA